MTVNKIGGKNMSKLDEVAKLVQHLKKRQEDMILVVSAFEGVTDALIAALDQLHAKDYSGEDIDRAFQNVHTIHERILDQFFQGKKEATHQQYHDHFTTLKKALLKHKKNSVRLTPERGSFQIRDQVIGFGEKMAGLFLYEFLEQEGNKAHFYEDVKAKKFETNGVYSHQKVHEAIRAGITKKIQESQKEIDRVKKKTKERVIQIFGGHVGGLPKGIENDVGRSYTDTTAVDVALSHQQMGQTVEATRVWKDVDGVMTVNPKDLEDPTKAVRHARVSMVEGLEMAAAGSTLMQIDALSLAQEHGIDIELKNIEELEQDGTVFTNTEITTGYAFKAILSNPNIDTVTFECAQMANRPGFGAAITKAFAKYNISLDGFFTDGTAVTVSIPIPPDRSSQEALRKKIDKAIKELETVRVKGQTYKAKLSWTLDSLACISVVGNEMANNAGMLPAVTSVLSAFGANILAISQATTQRRITILVDKRYRQTIIQKLHSIFVENDETEKREHRERFGKILDRLTGSFKKTTGKDAKKPIGDKP